LIAGSWFSNAVGHRSSAEHGIRLRHPVTRAAALLSRCPPSVNGLCLALYY
jgi:hypothetical protein